MTIQSLLVLSWLTFASLAACSSTEQNNTPSTGTTASGTSGGAGAGTSPAGGGGSSSTGGTGGSIGGSGGTAGGAPSWREIEIAEFVAAEYVRDTKVYRLRVASEFVFVFSIGRTSITPGTRTSWIGHVDPSDNVTLSDLNEVLYEAQGHKDWDVSDPHVYVTTYDPNHIWLSWNCGADNRMCAIRSDTRGKTFNNSTFHKWTNTVHFTVHEPSITCNGADDCLLGWGETIDWHSFDLLLARWTSDGWCDQPNHVGGDDRGIPLELPQATGANNFLVPTFAGSVDGGEGSVRSLDYTFTTSTSCSGVADNDQLVEDGFVAGVPAGTDILYDGAAANVAPRRKIDGTPTWLMYAHGMPADGHAVAMKAVRLDDGTTVTFSDTEDHVYVLAGNMDYDGERFYAFYHKLYGSSHPTEADTYSVCYRATADPNADVFGIEQCPVEHLPLRPNDTLGNVMEPVGAAWQGQLSIIYQKDCHYASGQDIDLCTVALMRYD